MELRPYQSAMVEKLRTSLQQGHRSPLLVAPCGSGKTVMFCHFAHAARQRQKRILILTHRSELLDQISSTLQQFGVRHGFIAPRYPKTNDAVTVGSVFSVVRRINRMLTPDLIIIDEAHHAIRASTFGRVLAAFPKAYRIGVTATPQRLSGEPLSDMFDDLILGPSVSELMDLGALSRYKLFAPSTIQTTDLHMRGGDYAKNELVVAADRPSITGDAVSHYLRLAKGKRAIAFCVSVQHAKHVADSFRVADVAAVSIDGSYSPDIRAGIIKDFRKGTIQVLTSCDLISEGFDLPAIETAIMLRPTASLALWIQQAGRSLRPYPGKEHAIILDHAGNTSRHGFPDDDREWTLEGRQRSKKESEASLTVRTCPKCFACLRSGVLTCEFCGYLFPIEARKVEVVDGTLEEIKKVARCSSCLYTNTGAARICRICRSHDYRNCHCKLCSDKKLQGKAHTFEDLLRLAEKRQYKNPAGWAHIVWNARQAKANFR